MSDFGLSLATKGELLDYLKKVRLLCSVHVYGREVPCLHNKLSLDRKYYHMMYSTIIDVQDRANGFLFHENACSVSWTFFFPFSC